MSALKEAIGPSGRSPSREVDFCEILKLSARNIFVTKIDYEDQCSGGVADDANQTGCRENPIVGSEEAMGGVDLLCKVSCLPSRG